MAVKTVRVHETDAATPTGIALGIGAAAVVSAVLVAATIPIADPAGRFGVVAGAVGLFAAWSGDQLALLGTAAIAWLLANGFLTDRLGELSWHGSSDLWRAVWLVAAGTAGLLLHAAFHEVHQLRAAQVNKEEKRDA